MMLISIVADFVLNIWSFCTMSKQDLFAHVFDIYGISLG